MTAQTDSGAARVRPWMMKEVWTVPGPDLGKRRVRRFATKEARDEAVRRVGEEQRQ